MPIQRRRRFILAGLAAATAGFAMPRLWTPTLAATTLPPTPACEDDDEPTPRQTEGPFYTPRSPERAALREAGMAGPPMLLSGIVLTRSCRPVAGALVDLWHADDSGKYDNEGYRLRGHQFTDAEGRYAFDTIVPGLYPGRTRHFHVKFQAPSQLVLTTQFYFPGEPGNDRDGIFRLDLVLTLDRPGEASFATVLDLA